MEPDAIAAGVGLASSADFSLTNLFLRADPVVKIVMGVLVLSSIWSWAIIFDKWFAFSKMKSQARRFEDVFWSGRPLEELYKKLGSRADHPMSKVFIAAMTEWNKSKELGRSSSDAIVVGAKSRIDKVMSVTVHRELEKAERNLGFLATVGSAAPFVGLFGTVWGIMNSFQAIALTKDTNLAVVAPGIAEALFATALGLFAAIPAVVAYNRFAAFMNSYGVRLQGFADEFSAILSRQFDERRK